MVRDGELKDRLRAIRSNVESESEDYTDKAIIHCLYMKKPQEQIENVSKEEMIKVYTGRMVPKDSKGRHIYDRIKSIPVNGQCPLCGIGTVNTIDHYLPKTYFPIFSVTPNNLVPVCDWCQGKKAEYSPSNESDQLLHPYFDDLDDEIWLVAEVVEGIPVTMNLIFP